MTKIQRTVFALVVLMTSSAVAMAQEEIKTIKWQTYDAPPNFIFEGEFAGQGFIEQLLAMIIKASPQFDHQFVVTSQNRALDNIRAGANVCHPSLVKTEARTAFIQFSRPLFISPTNRLVVRKGYLTNKPITLSDFIADKNHRFAVIRNRSYGKAVDKVLREHSKRHNVMFISNETSDYVFNLLGAERIDATIAYEPELAFYQARQINKVLSRLETIEINNNVPFVKGHIGCPKNPWGETVIDALNPIIASLVDNPEFKQKMSLWWPKEAKSQHYQRYYESNMR